MDKLLKFRGRMLWVHTEPLPYRQEFQWWHWEHGEMVLRWRSLLVVYTPLDWRERRAATA